MQPHVEPWMLGYIQNGRDLDLLTNGPQSARLCAAMPGTAYSGCPGHLGCQRAPNYDRREKQASGAAAYLLARTLGGLRVSCRRCVYMFAEQGAALRHTSSCLWTHTEHGNYQNLSSQHLRLRCSTLILPARANLCFDMGAQQPSSGCAAALPCYATWASCLQCSQPASTVSWTHRGYLPRARCCTASFTRT